MDSIGKRPVSSDGLVETHQGLAYIAAQYGAKVSSEVSSERTSTGNLVR